MTNKIKYRLTKETAQYALQELCKIFPKNEVDPLYSKGYQRWSKLSLTQSKALMVIHNFDYKACIDDLEQR